VPTRSRASGIGSDPPVSVSSRAEATETRSDTKAKLGGPQFGDDDTLNALSDPLLRQHLLSEPAKILEQRMWDRFVRMHGGQCPSPARERRHDLPRRELKRMVIGRDMLLAVGVAEVNTTEPDATGSRNPTVPAGRPAAPPG